MSASNEKLEDGNAEAKGQEHEGALNADAGKIVDMNALGEISGGTPGQDAPPMDSVADMYDALRPPKATGGREGESGA